LLEGARFAIDLAALKAADTAAGFSTGFNTVIDFGWFAFIGRPRPGGRRRWRATKSPSRSVASSTRGSSDR
jgi:hypothetical protein